MDEVAAGTTEREIPRILETIRRIRDMGITIIIIEHVMRVLVNAVDKIVVVTQGSEDLRRRTWRGDVRCEGNGGLFWHVTPSRLLRPAFVGLSGLSLTYKDVRLRRPHQSRLDGPSNTTWRVTSSRYRSPSLLARGRKFMLTISILQPLAPWGRGQGEGARHCTPASAAPKPPRRTFEYDLRVIRLGAL